MVSFGLLMSIRDQVEFTLRVGLPDMILRWDEMREKKKREKQGK